MPPVAFFAVTAIGTIGLYIAYVTPVYLRWRQGDSFEPRSWTLGPRYKWINPIAVVFVCLMFIILMLPFSSLGVPWEDDFDWSFFNYTPLVVGVVLLGAGLAWVLGHEQALHRPGPPDRVRRGHGDRRPPRSRRPPPAPIRGAGTARGPGPG